MQSTSAWGEFIKTLEEAQGKWEIGSGPICMEEDMEQGSPAAWASVTPCKKPVSAYI